MKRLSSISILFLSMATLAACGGGGGGGGGTAPPPPTPVATPIPTAVGAPAGVPVSATIGAAGGSLSTADGKIVLTIPAGALAADTVIGIQPLTNMAHGRIGAAYRLTPDGQQFLTPVTLTFAYTDQDLQGTAAEVLGAAFQTADGFWQWVGDATVDTTAKTVSVQSTHFTDYSNVKGAQIRPPSKTVKVSGTVALEVKLCFDLYQNQSGAILGYRCDSDDDEDTLPILSTISDWSVNGVLGGSGATGTVSGSGATATYTAPANKPNPSTVAVSARVQTPKGMTLVVSNITIVDNDSWVGTASVSDNTADIQASVTWEVDTTHPNTGGWVRYAPTGQVHVTYTELNNRGCTVTPTDFVLNSGDGYLDVDYSVNPPNFGGNGILVRSITATCDGVSFPIPFIVWFAGTGSVTENGTVIAGSLDAFSWRFTSQ